MRIENYIFSIAGFGIKKEITQDLVNVDDEELLKLDERGLVKVGTFVVKGDILAGCLTFVNSSQDDPETMTNTSFRMNEVSGKVVDVRIALQGLSGEILTVEVDVDLAAPIPEPVVLPDKLAVLLENLEISVFSYNVFLTNGLVTVGDLVRLGEVGFYEACIAYEANADAYDSTYPRKSLKEVKELLANSDIYFSDFEPVSPK